MSGMSDNHRRAPRVQFSGRPSGAPCELDANPIPSHTPNHKNDCSNQPNPRPQTIT